MLPKLMIRWFIKRIAVSIISGLTLEVCILGYFRRVNDFLVDSPLYVVYASKIIW